MPNNKRLNESPSCVKLFVRVITPIIPEFSLRSAIGGGRQLVRQETYHARSTIPVKKRNTAILARHSHPKARFTERKSSRLGTPIGVDMIQRQSEADDNNQRSGVLLRPIRASGRRFGSCTGTKCQGLGFGNSIRRLTLDARLRYMGIGKRLAKRHR